LPGILDNDDDDDDDDDTHCRTAKTTHPSSFSSSFSSSLNASSKGARVDSVVGVANCRIKCTRESKVIKMRKNRRDGTSVCDVADRRQSATTTVDDGR